mmetsp:Transcript_29867/g.84138  ORF Transcript_29867/g.84138 Transcript_29867/m.84138 type:complete len:215 (+) Transcript_29867:192-836(+)
MCRVLLGEPGSGPPGPGCPDRRGRRGVPQRARHLRADGAGPGPAEALPVLPGDVLPGLRRGALLRALHVGRRALPHPGAVLAVHTRGRRPHRGGADGQREDPRLPAPRAGPRDGAAPPRPGRGPGRPGPGADPRTRAPDARGGAALLRPHERRRRPPRRRRLRRRGPEPAAALPGRARPRALAGDPRRDPRQGARADAEEEVDAGAPHELRRPR